MSTACQLLIEGMALIAEEYSIRYLTSCRNWVFRKALPFPTKPKTSSAPSTESHLATLNPTSSAISTEGNTHSRTLVQTPVTLFRFSALTFNPHKIHYSLPWARDVEGHKD